MANRIVPFYTIATEYDQAGEDALAITLAGQPIGASVIFNTSVGKTRIWDGTGFASAPLLNPDGGNWGGAGYDGNPETINQDETHRFVTDTEKTKLFDLSGTNTGDQDLSGKQATLVSGTNIKTINSTSILGSGNIVIAGDPLPGTIVLLHTDETDSAETTSSTNETAAIKSFTLPSNSYTYIKIEAIVRSRNDADLAADPVYTWRIKEAGATVKTFTHTSIGITTTGIDGGDTHVSTLSFITAGGQGVNTALTITGQMSDSNSAIGLLVHAFRVYGIV